MIENQPYLAYVVEQKGGNILRQGSICSKFSSKKVIAVQCRLWTKCTALNTFLFCIKVKGSI